MNEKLKAIEEAQQHLAKAWGLIYGISKDEYGTELEELRSSINRLESKCLEIMDNMKEQSDTQK